MDLEFSSAEKRGRLSQRESGRCAGVAARESSEQGSSRTGALSLAQRSRLAGPAGGFTLVELMVGVVIFGILIAMSLPAFRKYMSTQQVEGTVNRLSGNLRLARQRAATEGNNYRVTLNLVAGNYSILDDDNNNSMTDPGETVLGPITIPAELTVTNGPTVPFPGDTLVFYPSGRANSTGTVTIANSKGHSRMLAVVRSTGAVAVR